VAILRALAPEEDEMARRSRSIAEWAAVVAAYEASGLSQDAFARQEGFAPSTLRYWRDKFRQAESRTDVSRVEGFIEVQGPKQDGHGSDSVVVRIGKDVALELSDLPTPEYLAELSRALSC
jgi:transposase-like protein